MTGREDLELVERFKAAWERLSPEQRRALAVGIRLASEGYGAAKAVKLTERMLEETRAR